MIRNYLDIFDDFRVITKNQSKKYVFLMLLSSGLYHIFSLLPPIATAGIIAMVTEENMNFVFLYGGLFLFFYFLYFFALYWKHLSYKKLGEMYHTNIQENLFEIIASNDDILTKISKGKIMDVCNTDITYIVDVVDAFVGAIMNLIKVFILFFIFLHYSVLVGAMVVVLDLFYFFLMDANSSAVSKCYEGQRKYDDKLIDILNQMLANLKQVKTLNLMGNLNKKLWKTRDCWKEKYSGRRDYMTKRYSILPGILYFTKFVLYMILASMVIKKQMTLDKLVLLISYFEAIVTATDQTLEYLLNLNNYKVRMQRIRSIVDYAPQKEFDFGDIDNDYISGLIEFKKVSYQVKDVKALDNVSFKVYPNEINAIIGHSGSGKSTIINLLYRLYKVTSGTILIDNVNIYDYTNHIYASNVSGVYQKPFVFDMSIRDNLNLVDSNRNHQIEACKRVGIHDFIMSLPKGYNTMIGEEDAVFTNGKKQLLAIARALLSKAEILLFDEITGNIDPETTNHVISILLDLKTDHTILMVTHKPEMMEIADRIIVLSDGKVDSKGKNKEVYEKSVLYQELKNRSFVSVSKVE